ncbi:phage tail sheath subtilisin-like domain-containing protein [Halomonas aquatica]|uniref:Phage tail sheath subtilisin-like domain-containing protein n=1 Tax=Halomonas aquatica TaxID=3151123 RepID=A0ABV1NI25_9GAMM
MATFRHPGVHVEEIPIGTRAIEGASTSIAAFLGYAVRGDEQHPTRLLGWDDYVNEYGGLRPTSDPHGDSLGHAVRAYFLNGGSVAYVIRLARGTLAAEGCLLHPDAPSTPTVSDQLVRFVARNAGTWGNRLRVRLASQGVREGVHRHALSVDLLVDGDYEEQERFVDLTMDGTRADFVEAFVNDDSALVRIQLKTIEPHLLGVSISEADLSGIDALTLNGLSFDVSLDDGSATRVNFAGPAFSDGDGLSGVAEAIQRQVRGGVTSGSDPRREFTASIEEGRLVLTSGTRTHRSAVVVTGSGDAVDAASVLRLGLAHGGTERSGGGSLALKLAETPNEVVLLGGDDGAPALSPQYDSALEALREHRDVSIVCLPDEHLADDGTGNAVVDAAIAHAESMRNRMVIVDPPPGHALTTSAEVNALKLPTSSYGVLYYPWVEVANPFFTPEPVPGSPRMPRTLRVPPCGFAAGIWARMDVRRGVWKAPAGAEADLLGVAGLEQQVENGHQAQLNPLGVNCLRSLPSFGEVIWGARTLATRAKPQWRYLPVRRTTIFIEQSLYNGIQWSVFEPNTQRLWSSLRLNIEVFMNNLFRAGAFQGGTAKEAYFVRCGLGDTMTQVDIDRGQVVVQVGFAPLKPAEFVLIRLQQKVGKG